MKPPRVNYYGKTYYVKVDDIGEPFDADVVGFYSVNLDGMPYIVTGYDIKEHPRVSLKLVIDQGNKSKKETNQFNW